MKFLFTSNPLHGHFMPMVPLIRAAAAAGHEVRVATGSDLTGLVRHHGFPLWLVGSTFSEAMASMPPAIFDRPPSDLERMRAGALTLFASRVGAEASARGDLRGLGPHAAFG